MKIKRGVLALLILMISVFILSSCSDGGVEDDVSFITLSKRQIGFEELGATHQLTAVLGPDDGTFEELQWSSSNNDIATCEGGLITARGFGTCVIKAQSPVSGATCVVTVTDPNPTISLSVDQLTLGAPGSSAVVKALSGSGFDVSGDVIWMCSNRNVVTCHKGKVEAVGYGICTVTALSKNGSSATCVVSVVDPNAPTVTVSDTYVELDGAGDEFTLTATTSPKRMTVCGTYPPTLPLLTVKITE